MAIAAGSVASMNGFVRITETGYGDRSNGDKKLDIANHLIHYTSSSA